MNDAVIVGYARTPIGKLLGGLASLSAMDLGGRAIAAALDRSGVAPDQVDQVLMGHVVQAGQGQITARQAALAGGIGMEVPATTINKVCLSGTSAVALANQLIRFGDADVVVAGGMESMTGGPYLLPRARTGYRMGDAEIVDATIHDGLWCALDHEHMGAASDRMNDTYGIGRERQDEWAARSHRRAADAWKNGRFDDEVVSVEVPQRRGDPVTVAQDEGIRADTTAEGLGRLRPAFSSGGTITAGNASQVSDGAAALVLASAAKADELGLEPLARITSYGTVAGPDPSLHHQPAEATRRAAARVDLDPAGLDVYEINEAFAAVALWSAELLGVDEEKVNPNGGAVALGHPIGCSGARLVGTTVLELRRRGGGRGVATLCGGGGQGDAVIVETL
ncbi:MAG TPA: acetyl-CoA C-acetyltransferase [Euzebyales bacterium]|nr:acetyl-CoA C-acetyltransferase [Euzebyales bacterium]